MKYSYLLLSIFLCSLSGEGITQNNEKDVVRVGDSVGFGRSGDALTQQILHDENNRRGHLSPPSSGEINRHKLPPELLRNANTTTTSDEATLSVISSFSGGGNSPDVNISSEGYSSDDNANLLGFRVTPPDTNGDVGLTQYAQYVNLGWVVFDKVTGQQIAGPFPGNSFWQSLTGSPCQTENAGDPIVLYDHLADRWVFTQFVPLSVGDGHQCFAISDREDLTQANFTLYDFIVSPSAFNDFPKLALSQNAYVMTSHEFSNPGLTFTGVNVNFFDREAMLASEPTASFIQFTGSTSGDDIDFGAQPAHLEGENARLSGSCNYFVHATDSEIFPGSGLPPGQDGLRFWKGCVDFDDPSAATLIQLDSVIVPDFNQNFCGFDRNCIDQNSASGQLLDALSGFTQYRFNTRHFPNQRTLIGNQGLLKGAITTNVNVGGNRAGVFWASVDINLLTDTITISDDGAALGVVDFDDNLNRWMGSASLDKKGNIGIGYNVAGPGMFPSLAMTVYERGVNGPGEVQSESLCIEGTGSTEGANRWGDYNSTSVDPVDSCTFWYTGEYVETTGSFQWNTRVCSAVIPSCLFLLGDANLDGVLDLLDVNAFVNLLINGDFLDEADINRDGVVNLLDVNPFVELINNL